MRSAIILSLTTLALATACGPVRTKTTGVPDYPAPPFASTSTDAASKLALRAWIEAGGQRWPEVAQLDFTFVVTDGAETKASVRHRWDLRKNRDRVTWKDKTGVVRDVVVDLATKEGEALVDGKKAEGATRTEALEKAYARWVNDSYWLLLPLKTFDPGVTRTLEAPRDHGGKTYDVVRLEFASVGLTPGDRYWLFFDRDTGRIARWEMVLQGDQPPPKGNSWTDYRAVGPLVLAHDHVTDDGQRHIRFDATAAHEAVDEAAFRLEP
ncbi:hypothetical protein L6R52_37025 [Myxococcota bacterium]|nr:hypothetical protein [Myxococcota bacterium]